MLPTAAKPIPGFPDYHITPDGSIYSTKWNRTRLLKAWLLHGYLTVGLRIGGKYSFVSIHRLIALTFIPNTDEKPHVLHRNDIRTDNRIENLYWGTHTENIREAIRNGRELGHKGDSHHNAKLFPLDILMIRRLKKGGWKERQIAPWYGIQLNTVCQICSGERWSHIPM
jgi:hypothetical protein